MDTPPEHGHSPVVVTIQSQFPRYHRTPEAGRPLYSGSIRGLIDLYITAGMQQGHAVEVGCWTGESAEIACQFVGHLFCVDPWNPPDFSLLESTFDERMAAYPNVTKIKKASHEACNDFGDGSLALVYIDAMHDYDNVKRDILCWFPKVCPFSWISGHDYDDMETHTGVVQAVDEVLGVPQMRFSDSSFLFLKTPELVARVEGVTP